MPRREEEEEVEEEQPHGSRRWTRFWGGSAFALALALPAATLAAPASEETGAAEVRAPAQPEAQAAEASPATTSATALEEPMSGRSNCQNDYTQTCFQPGSSGPAGEQPESYAQSHFQPAAQPER
jgi:hypothetical protein